MFAENQKQFSTYHWMKQKTVGLEKAFKKLKRKGILN